MEEKLYTKAQIERTDKGMVAIASTAVEDRHGEVVSLEGWDVRNFKKNPVLLWAHNHDEIAVGYAKNLKKDMSFIPVFHDKTDKARALKALYEGYVDDDGVEVPPVLNSFSVGFRALEMDGNTYTKQELLEISAVNVPANPEARVIAYKAFEKEGISKEQVDKLNILTTDDIKEPTPTPEPTPEPKEDKDVELEKVKQELAEVKEDMKYLVKGLQHLNPMVDKKEAIEVRLTLAKVVGRATDRLLEQKPKNASLLKVIKRANDRLINDAKQELKFNGKNQRPS